jgi:glycosyltransferase involved in cell wall biosynthesis
MSAFTVTIGISAFNEEKTLPRLFDSVFTQDQSDYSLKNVILVSDGSTDGTPSIGLSRASKSVETVAHSDRAGKSARLLEIAQRTDTDALVFLDADVLLASPSVVSALIAPIKDGKATLVSGRPVKDKTGTFFDGVMDVSLALQDAVKEVAGQGHAVYACHGRVMALAKPLYHDLLIPSGMVADDAYLYFYNKIHGQGFAFVKEASVLFRMPQNVSDFAKQQRRFAGSNEQLVKEFGDSARQEYALPLGLKLKALGRVAVEKPIDTLAYIFLRALMRFYPVTAEVGWSMSDSTKVG